MTATTVLFKTKLHVADRCLKTRHTKVIKHSQRLLINWRQGYSTVHVKISSITMKLLSNDMIVLLQKSLGT